MLRILALLSLLTLTACAGANDLDRPPAPLGNFSLGHNIVVAPNLVKGPLSREATAEEWTEAMTAALAERFDRYEGEKLYHFGVSLEGYVLAQPGIPVVLAPKSVLIFRLTVWDDSVQQKLNPEPEEITVIESLASGALIGSGYTLTREEQLAEITRIAAKQVERFLSKKNFEDKWFGGRAANRAQPKPVAEEVVVEDDENTSAEALKKQTEG